MKLDEFLKIGETIIEEAIDKKEKEINVYDEKRKAFIGRWTEKIQNYYQNYQNSLIELFDSFDDHDITKEQAAQYIRDYLMPDDTDEI